MRIASELAGFSLGEADLLRKAMGKKKADVMQAQRQKFVDGARQRGTSEKKAAKIFDLMEHFAGYGFPKAHATAYAVLAYQTGAGLMDKIQMLPKLAELSGFFPKTVKKAPCQEVVLTGDQVDLTRIPVLKCWPADGGRFITLPMVCTLDAARITNVAVPPAGLRPPDDRYALA
jgi:hypothetical protein